MMIPRGRALKRERRLPTVPIGTPAPSSHGEASTALVEDAVSEVGAPPAHRWASLNESMSEQWLSMYERRMTTP